MAWHLHLKGSQEPTLAQRYIDIAKQKQKRREQGLINDWVDHDSEFDYQSAIALWESIRKHYGKIFLHEMLKTYALSNSLLDVNTIRSKELGMKDEGISIEIFNPIIEKMFLLNMTNAIVEGSSLTQSQKADVMSRAIARQFPNKENRNQQSSTVPLFENLKKQVESFTAQHDEPIDTGA